MMNKQLSILLLTVLLFSIPSHAIASNESLVVEQFGDYFDEVVIADSSDRLSNPRDLEFHPGRINELWIANRNSDSITIVENTGLDNQTSQNREDSNSNHFLEEVSAISFGAYDPEFDWQWGSAQETTNTFCGPRIDNGNNFMGPTLWPSSLSHFAVENQNNGNGLLGSHIDMNHESPYGVGIAHDSANAYWYNDGYYGELVFYDFQEDHDTGEDDHSDGIVRRYSEVQLTHTLGVPGHMIMDKSSGILYIADAGANRVLWVNTDDTSVASQNIMNEGTRLEPLQEYSRMSGIEWGVLATGLDRPSGIALDGDELFVSQNGNGEIIAYNLNSDGKGTSQADSIQTSASSIMGLEIGPNGHLYYVDNVENEVVRIDPYLDQDGDGIGDLEDNCISVANFNQDDHDSDTIGDSCDEDYDNDGILNPDDDCAFGDANWLSSSATDHDGDGCRDISEDLDDDNDGYYDTSDYCPFEVGTSNLGGVVGCLDSDGDGYSDTIDGFPLEPTQWYDSDNDGFGDNAEGNQGDACIITSGTSSQDRIGCPDSDNDGWSDSDASWLFASGADVFPNDYTQHSDSDGDGYGDAENGFQADDCPDDHGNSTKDRLGCLDSDGDGWSDSNDLFVNDSTQYADIDLDGFGDSESGNLPDACPESYGLSFEQRFGCPDSDGDGWDDELDSYPEDVRLWSDIDSDGHPDQNVTNMTDDCPKVSGTSYQDRIGCLDSDGDGWSDEVDLFPMDSSRYLKSESIPSEENFLPVITVGVILIILISLALVIRNRSNNPAPIIHDFNHPIIHNNPMIASGPPLPPEGLPPGWTLEQWAWYGAEYLKNR